MSQGAARVTAGALNGGAAGGANSVASTGVAVGEQYVAARREFARSIEGQKLTSQEFDEAYESFMSRRGMTFETIATQFGREVALGILSGKIGGATGAVKQGARTTIQKFATESGEVVANAGIGLGVAAVQGDLSVEGVTNVLAGTAVGTVTGRVSHEYARPIVNEIPVKLEHAAATSKRALRGSPTMNNVVEQMLFDTAHPMDVTRNLQHRGRQIPATHGLQEFASAPRINEQDFISFINEGSVQPLPFKNNDRELSYHHDRKRAEILRESLLLQDPELYGVSNNPSPRQLAKVRHYAEHLREQSLPDLVDSINTVVGPRDIDGFPTVNARAKGASGLIDKIDRMRTGNFGKEPRPDYVLADMPDALGARITVKDPRDLPAIIERFEAQYQGRIIEKDNFYTNPSKREKPYRVITYTVMTGDVPCEVQITTLASSLAADINHNTVYKQILPTTEEQRRELIDRWHGVTKRETELLLKNNFWPRS
jgi:ppGpp synthetase/RelA/SpoT-type nucleotidyltranferase